jgi:predicted membrane metal-binding protein
MIIIIGGLDFFEGLIAVIRGDYYAVTANQIVVVNLTTWGWIMMIWGVVLLLAGFGLLSGATWARWFAIVVASLNVIAQLGFVGSAQYPLWALTVLTLTIVVLYALIVHWDDGTQPA